MVIAGGNSYQYDANGNMTSGAGRTLQWSTFNKPTQIIKGQAVTHKQFIYAGGSLVATHNSGLDSSGATKPVQTRYFHKDNLGSIDTITDGIGNVVERMSFDPFGGRRQSNWRASTVGINLIPILTNRGFTGHEHLDGVDLIHMNGRVYDAALGRFLSADPHIQAPYATQSFNRYSYAMNNPMKYTDPTGYNWLSKTWKKAWGGVKKVFENKVFRVIVAIVAVWVIGPLASQWYMAAAANSVGGMAMAFSSGAYAGIATGASVFGGAVAGFAGGLISSGGDLKAGLIGAITGGAAGFIGSSAFGAPGVNAGRVLGHGVVGGVSSKLQGGKFINGFMSSAFTKTVSGRIHGAIGSATPLQRLQGAIAAAAVGGTASRLGGGNFANGAQTSAFQYLLNEVKEVFTRGVKDVPRMFGEFVDRSLPTRATARTALAVASNGLLIGALTPCSVYCAGVSTLIDRGLAVDNYRHDEVNDVYLTLLPGVVGGALKKYINEAVGVAGNLWTQVVIRADNKND